MKRIDEIIDGFTIYRVTLYGLLFLTVVAFFYSFFGLVVSSPLNLLTSLILIVGTCYLTNKFFAKIFSVPTNNESFFITALILFLILAPLNSIDSAVIFLIAGTVAMASKYVLAVNKKHIFNPAAFALVVVDLIGSSQVQWWVGNKYMFPFILIIGFLIVRKVSRFHLFLSFISINLLTVSIFSFFNKIDILSTLIAAITSWPLLFLGTIMLTEPFTTPPSQSLQIVYGGLVGVLAGSPFHFGMIYLTSELALILGNIYSYIVSFKYRLILALSEKKQLSPTIYEFVFSSLRKFNFLPGQYLEWTLPLGKIDSRGNRRYFTIASSPTEENVRLGVRINFPSSSFKKALVSVKKGNKIYAGQLRGDFVLPEDEKRKLVFIAGGIGITPFRSMIKYILDKKIVRPVVLIYSNKKADEIAYKDVFDQAQKDLRVKIVYTLTDKESVAADWKGEVGRVDAAMIRRQVPDYQESLFYLSGPQAMVTAFEETLSIMGIKGKNIKKDFFPGF